MGEAILNFYNSKIKKQYKIAFISSFFISLMIHLYKFANTLPNRDSLYNYYSDQNVLQAGRWALSWACGISSYYDLPWVNGLMSCFFLALTVVVIVSLLRIKNPVLIVLTGALLAAAPATTETFYFLFTADGYMLSMFLAALGVYLSRIDEKRDLYQLAAVICICVSCGIYQAYVSFALILSVCCFIRELFAGNHDKKTCERWVLRQILIYVIALVSYYMIWKWSMLLSNVLPTHYQGISQVGQVSFGLFVNGAIRAVKTTVLYFLQWNILEKGISFYCALSLFLFIAFIGGVVIAFVKSKLWTRKWAVVFLALCLLSIAPFACIWHFTSDFVRYRVMMLQSLTLLFVLVGVLWEEWGNTVGKNIICIFLFLMVFNNALLANISYYYMNLCYERTYADGLEMMIKIHNFKDKYDFTKIAVLGNRRYELQTKNIDPQFKKLQTYGKLHSLNILQEKTLLYDSDHTTKFLQVTFGLDLKVVDFVQRNAMLDTEKVRNMGRWPAGNSMAVMRDTLVIKLSDRKE